MVSLFLTEVHVSNLKLFCMCTGTKQISKYTVNDESSSLSEISTQRCKVTTMHKGHVRMNPVRVAWDWNIYNSSSYFKVYILIHICIFKSIHIDK